ncbi:NAD(P)H-quinone oxidoreductase [Sphingobacterium lumbrici]|uniref:NAD(P)H-quinone oxidoreductase n=1 Tax=Sphingobacterium lumbrici TaxID=2559600 RepID=UPI001126E10F|nr:NAD(P)H-quinone oxidoreductase [Sphingobacterium lumbrici]
MKAVVISEFGKPEVLKIEQRDIPKLKVGYVLIEVYAAGINRPDIFQRKGNYPAPAGAAQDIPGLEVAGKIVAVGKGVDGSRIGDAVMALLSGGGYAEYTAVHIGSCILIPKNLSFVEAASLPETVFTVWHNVFQRGKLKYGDRLLIHGGSGGIGTTAIQLACLFGAKVYTTVGSEEKGAFTKELGAFDFVNYHNNDYEKVWYNEKINIILDSIGGDYFAKNFDLLESDGTLVYINAMKGAKVEMNLLKLMQKRICLTGSTLRARDENFKAELAREIEKNVIPLLEEGKFKTNVYAVFPLEEVVKAHQLMEDGDFMGKIVLNFKAK